MTQEPMFRARDTRQDLCGYREIRLTNAGGAFGIRHDKNTLRAAHDNLARVVALTPRDCSWTR
jgi:hypothetical protein